MFNLVIIDDELFQLNIMKNYLDWNAFGFRLQGAFFNSGEALEYIKNNKVDLIITDIAMPDVTGIDIAKHCFYNSKNTKVIFTSAYQDFDYAKEAIKYNVCQYLTKPFTKQKVTDAILSAFDILNNSSGSMYFVQRDKSDALRSLYISLISNVKNNSQMAIKPFIEGTAAEDSLFWGFASVEISEAQEYVESKWTHGKDSFINALEQIINTEYNCTYCIMTNFYKHGFDLFFMSKTNISEISFGRFMDTYTESLKPLLKECLRIDISITNKFVTDDMDAFVAFARNNIPNRKTDSTKDFMVKVKEYVEKNYYENITLDKIAAMMGFSTVYFAQIFKKKFGVTFVNYLADVRIEAAKRLLVNTDEKVTSIYNLVGFSEHAYFSRKFKKHTGFTPLEYRNKYKKVL